MIKHWSNSLDDADPELAQLYSLCLDRLNAEIKPYFGRPSCVWRDLQTQTALRAQGRRPVDVVNVLRRAVGLWTITEAENYVVTWTIPEKSLHTQHPSRAIDTVILLDPDDAGPLKAFVPTGHDTEPMYRRYGEIAGSLGLVWGGVWRKPDMPHVQLMPPGRE